MLLLSSLVVHCTPASPAPPCHVQGLLYPLDTIRTRLAVCKTASYTGIMHSARRIWAEEGFTAFYRGGSTGMPPLGWALGRDPGAGYR